MKIAACLDSPFVAVRSAATLCVVFCLAPVAARAQSFSGRTSLVEAFAGGGLSTDVRQLESGGYELANGTPITFTRWYSSNWRDLHLTWVTAVTRDFGIYWGFSTGERGAKYRINPGLKVGFIAMKQLAPDVAISLSATTILGGRLAESSCIADYGQIGGIQAVNCRLAAAPLPPSQTLKYLLNLPPPGQVQIGVRLIFRF